MLHAHGTRTQSRGRADRGLGRVQRTTALGFSSRGGAQPGGNPVPLAPSPFAGRSRPRSEPGANPGFLANLYDLHPLGFEEDAYKSTSTS